MPNSQIRADQLLTSHEVGTLLQVNPTSINKWVSQGRIAAFRTPGGHRRIRAADLISFLNTHQMPVPPPLKAATERRLLVVDDDRRQLRALERLLSPYGSRIQVAFEDNGIDALVKVGSFRPHLVVLDIFMPEIDGLEVCRRLKANPETREIAVLVQSGQLTRALVDDAREAGALGCVEKPLDHRTIAEALGLGPDELAAR